ncbi:MAG: thermonuclease family protein [Cognatishimia sp.]|uniref:thermonuclease family protein n=1 Tax=Cognatishimia sp. TaxID=2211648 RepID=UPI003B8B933E
MARKGRKVISFSRDYRRAMKFDMGLPKKKPPPWKSPIAATIKVILVLFVTLLVSFRATEFWIAYLPQEGMGSCRIVSVVDGDTVKLRCERGKRQTARLMGYDAPELFSPSCAKEHVLAIVANWELLKALAGSQSLILQSEGRDRYQRILLQVWVDQTPLQNIMISAGYAVPYSGGKRRGWC